MMLARPTLETRIEHVARAMSAAFGENPDEMRPATGYQGAPLVPKWRLHDEWARRHLAAHALLSGDDLSADAVKRDKAVAAAHGASEATAQLLRFAREGNGCEHNPFNTDVVEQLLDAAKLAIEVEGAHTPERREVLAAVTAYLTGWR